MDEAASGGIVPPAVQGRLPSVHLPGLNALRFYAAISVVFVHIDHFGELFPASLIHFQWSMPGFIDGYNAVSLFFVLSGYLITYLLIKEQDATGTVAVGRFYARRALRIWPLYYLTVAVGVIVLPLLLGPTFEGYRLRTVQYGLVLVMLPNVANALYSLVALSHLWSIGVEEQYYAVWPLVVKYGRRVLVLLTAGIIAIKLLLEPLVLRLDSPVAHRLWEDARFECMAVGALAAMLVLWKPEALRGLYSRVMQVVVVVSIVAILTLTSEQQTTAYNVAISLLFATVILNLSTNPRVLVRLEHPLLDRLGNISYGIYMWHMPITYLVLTVLRRYIDGIPFLVLAYVTIPFLTVVSADLSYRLIERRFLRLKSRFQVVPSTANAELPTIPA